MIRSSRALAIAFAALIAPLSAPASSSAAPVAPAEAHAAVHAAQVETHAAPVAPAKASADACICADNQNIVYIGRVLKENGCVSYDWSGVTVRICFTGTQLSMLCSDSGKDYFNVWVDQEPSAQSQSVICISGENQTVQLAKNLKKGTHHVILQKRTEGSQGRLSINSFNTDGRIESQTNSRTRCIEFIGDSYTCGYGTEGPDRTDPFKAETENCNLAYAQIIGRFFDADVTTISHSGIGIARNYNDEFPGLCMPARYTRMFDEADGISWAPQPDSPAPDIVVIYLGTNDFSVGKQPSLADWCKNYTLLLKQIRSYYSESVPIFCVASMANELMGWYVQSAVQRSGVPNVSWTAIQTSAHNDTSDLGSSWHPNYRGQRKVASIMIPYIATLTGWDMPLKPIQ